MNRSPSGCGMDEEYVQTMQKMLLVQQKKELLRAKHCFRGVATTPRSAHRSSGSELLDSSLVETAPRPPPDNLRSVMAIVMDPTAILLLAWPLGLASYYLEWGPAPTFWLNFLAMIPLAKILGDATEELAAALKSDAIGGLLNATFGNLVEMILTIQTLRVGKLDVVKGTLMGSVLSNLLLVLGMSFFIGGLTPLEGRVKGKEQSFSARAALTNMTMLFLATAAFAFPTVFFSTPSVINFEGDDAGVLTLKVSRWCSIYILIAYLAFLIFQLYTHVDVFASGEDDSTEEAQLSPWVAALLLFVTTLFVAASSEWLVHSIHGLVEDWGMGEAFIGIVLLPIVGNACEHAGAIRMAMAEKVDITIGIAVGSSTQIALFVVPFSVLAGWLMDQPMDLNFGSLMTTVMVFAVLLAFSIITDGASNWLEGFMLMIAYAVVATLFWFFPEM